MQQAERLASGHEQGDIDAALAELNGRQREAASHDDGPLLVVAGAGTGKTLVLAHRVAYLIAGGADPSRILLLTFTRRAAAEMLHRVDGILRRLRAPAAATRKVWGGTFHAVAARLLRLHGRSIGLDPAFTILGRSDSEDLLSVVRSELGLAKSDRRFPKKATCLDVYSRCVNSRKRLEDVLEAGFPWCRGEADDLRELFSAYVDRKETLGVLDYDDLLLFWRGLLADPIARTEVRERFDYVLVDEYQDTNVLQAETLGLLRPGGGGLTVVGDDAQAIYSFRAATVRNILDFPAEFLGTKVVKLEENYRSTAPILEATNRIIGLARERHAKDLWCTREGGEPPVLVTCRDEDEQSEFLIRRILEHRESGLDLRRQAVLFRAAHHSLALELELARRNIPYHKYGGLKFAETAHVKDLMGFLRLAENPRDLMAGMRVLLLIPGVGPKKARQAADLLAGSGGDFTVWSEVKPPAAATALWPRLIELMTGLADAPAGELAAQIDRITLFYGPLLERLYDEPQSRLRDLEQLGHLTGRFPDRARFLAEITLDPPSYTEDLAGPPYLDDDYLILSTMHSAKGLEWDAVYVIHAADGNIPSDLATGRAEEIDEELRLFYVALTRAKSWLYVCFPLCYYTHPRDRRDTHGYAQLTRFMPEVVRGHFQVQSVSDGHGGEDGTDTPGVTTTADIRDGLKDLWSAGH